MKSFVFLCFSQRVSLWKWLELLGSLEPLLMYTDEVPFVWSVSTLSKCSCFRVCMSALHPPPPSVETHTTKNSLQGGTGNKLARKPDLFEVRGSWFKLPAIKYVSSSPNSRRSVFLGSRLALLRGSHRFNKIKQQLFPVLDIILAKVSQWYWIVVGKILYTSWRLSDKF